MVIVGMELRQDGIVAKEGLALPLLLLVPVLVVVLLKRVLALNMIVGQMILSKKDRPAHAASKHGLGRVNVELDGFFDLGRLLLCSLV